MKGFLEEYGLIIVVVAVILLMLLFGKTGYAKGIQDAILGSAGHIVETGENIAKKEVHVTAGDTLDIEGTKYVVLEKKDNNQALVVASKGILRVKFQDDCDFNTKLRPDGKAANTYEGSTIDNYLENDWYNSLSSTMKSAIQTTNIKQVSYTTDNSPDSKQETGPNGQVYNTISRHVFLPSISEISKMVNLSNPVNVSSFINNVNMVTRDSSQTVGNNLAGFTKYGAYMSISFPCDDGYDFKRPAFVIDLSQVDYKVAGHTNYNTPTI